MQRLIRRHAMEVGVTALFGIRWFFRWSTRAWGKARS
jgi:hypothetical protein